MQYCGAGRASGSLDKMQAGREICCHAQPWPELPVSAAAMQTAVQVLRSWEPAVFSDFLRKPPPPPLASLGLPSAQEQKEKELADTKTVEALRRMSSKRTIEREVFKKHKKKGGKRHKK